MHPTRWLLALLLALSFAASAQDPPADAGEAAQYERLTQARELTATGRHDDAIALIDQTLAYYQQKYPDGTTRWYVARSLPETLLYMAGAALGDQPDGKKEAQALDVLWAEAYYMKAYALFELDRLDDAKAMLAKALYLTPKNSRYLSELGQVHQTRREWADARRQYEAAEAAAEFSPEEEKKHDRGRAKRGIGFVLIEQGQLDAAEAKFRECLALDADDDGAKAELDYIADLRAKSAGKAVEARQD